MLIWSYLLCALSLTAIAAPIPQRGGRGRGGPGGRGGRGVVGQPRQENDDSQPQDPPQQEQPQSTDPQPVDQVDPQQQPANTNPPATGEEPTDGQPTDGQTPGGQPTDAQPTDPQSTDPQQPADGSPSQTGGCTPSSSSLDTGGLDSPNGPIKFAGIGVGFQLYNCDDTTGKFVSNGATATLFDASCLSANGGLGAAEQAASSAWQNADSPDAVGSSLNLQTLGSHSFVTNPTTGTGLSPRWDVGGDFVIAAKTANKVVGGDNVDDLSLKAVQGGLASQIWRVDTFGGQPPASCQPGSGSISVKYTATYFLA